MTTLDSKVSAASAPAVREHLVRALEADLIGPYDGEHPEEVLKLAPSRWYLTGFLAPEAGRFIDDPTEDDELAAGSDEDDEDATGGEPTPKQRPLFPASAGMSVILPPRGGAGVVEVTLTWADYATEARLDEASGRERTVWRRRPHESVTTRVALDPAVLAQGVPVADSGGVRIVGRLEETDAPGLPRGARALSLFVVNGRAPQEKWADERFLFQVRLELAYPGGILPRASVRSGGIDDWDEDVFDLQFRERSEYAVGHGVAVEEPTPDADGLVRRVCTTWIPRAEVRRVRTREEPDVVTAMEELAELADAEGVRAALLPLVDSYGEWIGAQGAIELDNDERRNTRDLLVVEAERARERIRMGIELVATNPEAREAFGIANRAMALAARQRSPERYTGSAVPKWRLFQLAFVLLSLPSVEKPDHVDRERVELVFFPTGGGKTEAYLGVIAFALVLRRLRGGERPDGGLGVAVLLRYTLRLLTLDQLGRAATLMCALEMLRKAEPARLGEVRFAVGLWVGKSATANTLAEVGRAIAEYKLSASPNALSPCPLTSCPWCGKALERGSLSLRPATKPEEVIVACTDRRCDFSARREPRGLPVVFVDEQIYRELPAFLVATVDKFAMLPWRGETGMLFGRVRGRRGERFTGPLDKRARDEEPLADGLLPPELIVQDELHLIAGPLGTMVGLYETGIEALCSRRLTDGKVVRPKILASTATVRRARYQVQALFGRRDLAIFPPAGIDDSDTFFARRAELNPGRLYVGVAAAGRSMKAVALRTYVALLAAAAKRYAQDGAPAADAYMTIAGYFNSLRELGGMRRLVEDDVRTRAQLAEERKPLDPAGGHLWYRNRKIQSEPVELTSREPTGRIAKAKESLAREHAEDGHVDVLLASNMISVGVDIERLGLMVVAGQPTSTSEYIQATSRVGRDVARPGLVVTCYNLHKPRDRSYYERFAAYHGSFYRFVEAQSLTPFSGPALERGLAGALLTMARLIDPVLTPPSAAMAVEEQRAIAEEAALRLAERAGGQPGVEGRFDAVVAGMRARCRNLIDAWIVLTKEAREAAGSRSYSPFDREKAAGKPLLFLPTDEVKPPPGTDDAKFAAPTSMREVEPTTHVWVERRQLGGRA